MGEVTTFLGLSIQIWLVIFVVIVLFYMLTRTRVPAEVSFLGAVTFLLATNIIAEHDVLVAFGSEAILVTGTFYIILAGLMNTGVLYWLSKYLLGKPSSFTKAIFKIMVPASILSAMIGCLEVTHLFTDMVKIWARKLAIAPSKLLMPLSYAASFGGMCTLLGHTSNLVVAGLYVDQTGKALNLFAPFIPGFACTVVGICLMTLLRNKIPSRKSPDISFEDTSDYTVELLVPTDNEAVMHSIDEAGLRNVKGGSLIELVRFDKEVISPVPPDEYIFGGDRLVYSGQINELLELKNSHGLVVADHHVYNINEIDSNRKLRTAYINFGSELIGSKMSEGDFEKRNDMVLVAVARQGKRVDEQPREVILQAGDTLLLECPAKKDTYFETRYKHALIFFDSQFVPRLGIRTVISASILIIMFMLSSFQVVPLITSTMLAAGAMLIFECCRMDNITKYIDWNFLLTLGAMMVFSTAIANSGLVDIVSNPILELCAENPYIIMIVSCFLASIMSELFSDVSAAAVFFPFIYHQAITLGCDPMPFTIALMTSVTISYTTPISSVTHMHIFGPGGFKFTDFLHLGIWMHLILLAVNLITIILVFPLY
ncbi:MAG: SLC13 family permease [Bacteroidaceae bacterium]|nr:SLC13 family permease [Bacteroidaceae bacterium]